MKEAVSGCPLEETMRVLGGRWRIVLVYYLLEGKKRFSELRRLMPEISQRMLTLDLRTLEQAGLVTRTVYPEVPVRVEYELSAEGLRLKPLVDLMGEVGERLTQSRTCQPSTRAAA